MRGTFKGRERVTIDQDRCRSATRSLQQSHIDNIPSPFHRLVRLAGKSQGGRLHILPCADKIDLAWTQGSREWLALEAFIDTCGAPQGNTGYVVLRIAACALDLSRLSGLTP